MDKMKVLDCTLRDGGYCNQWEFGFSNAREIVGGLGEAGIDIIECGYLTEKASYHPDVTKFTVPEEAGRLIPADRKGKMYVCMLNFGEYDAAHLPVYDGSSIDGIRVAFHKKDAREALALCREIGEKGYKIFVQAMVSLSYTDEEFLALIRACNEIMPYAFYIVDSFGVMKRKDLVRMFYMVEHNLKEEIAVGYHSHNNMQLAYSNAQTLADIRTSRSIIIDSSVYGMGRGAGNLNTELFVEYLNDTVGAGYKLKPLLNLIDSILQGFYQRNYWGYSLPNYLSAAHSSHPDYAGYLDEKHTLTVEDMDEIFGMMDDEKRARFDKEYIEELYLRYMSAGQVQEEHRAEFQKILEGKKVLLIAPGISSETEKGKIARFAGREDVVSISVNFAYREAEVDYIFLSNLRRFREMESVWREKCIVTSNIPADNVYLKTNYQDLLNSDGAVRDNAGMMAIRFLILSGVGEIYLAGFDGYSHDALANYGDSHMTFVARNAVVDAMNKGLAGMLGQYGEEIRIEFLTAPKYLSLFLNKEIT